MLLKVIIRKKAKQMKIKKVQGICLKCRALNNPQISFEIMRQIRKGLEEKLSSSQRELELLKNAYMDFEKLE